MGYSYLFILLFIGFTALYGLTNKIVSLVSRLFFGAQVDVARDYTNQPRVTVMISAFNEGAAVYNTVRSIRQSSYPQDKLQIIVRDDCSVDDTYEWIQKAAQDFGADVARNARNQGKPHTMCDMVGCATGEIVISTDSDCILDPDAIRHMVSCFKDQRIAAVGGVIGIANVNDNYLTQAQTIMYGCTFYLFKAIENTIRRVQCLGGALVAFRKETFKSLIPVLRNRNFLGEKIMNGEDRAVTQLLLFTGHRTYVDFRAKCWANTPTKFSGFLKQQLRWRRSALGQWLLSTFCMTTRLKHGGLITTMGSLFPAISILVGYCLALYFGFLGMLIQFLMSALVLGVILGSVAGVIFNLTVGRLDGGRQKIQNPFFTAVVLAGWGLISTFLITPWALCTIDDGGWVTRQLAVPKEAKSEVVSAEVLPEELHDAGSVRTHGHHFPNFGIYLSVGILFIQLHLGNADSSLPYKRQDAGIPVELPSVSAGSKYAACYPRSASQNG